MLTAKFLRPTAYLTLNQLQDSTLRQKVHGGDRTRLSWSWEVTPDTVYDTCYQPDLLLFDLDSSERRFHVRHLSLCLHYLLYESVSLPRVRRAFPPRVRAINARHLRRYLLTHVEPVFGAGSRLPAHVQPTLEPRRARSYLPPHEQAILEPWRVRQLPQE